MKRLSILLIPLLFTIFVGTAWAGEVRDFKFIGDQIQGLLEKIDKLQTDRDEVQGLLTSATEDKPEEFSPEQVAQYSCAMGQKLQADNCPTEHKWSPGEMFISGTTALFEDKLSSMVKNLCLGVEPSGGISTPGGWDLLRGAARVARSLPTSSKKFLWSLYKEEMIDYARQHEDCADRVARARAMLDRLKNYPAAAAGAWRDMINPGVDSYSAAIQAGAESTYFRLLTVSEGEESIARLIGRWTWVDGEFNADSLEFYQGVLGEIHAALTLKD